MFRYFQFIIISTLFILTSCGDTAKEHESKIEVLDTYAQLQTLINDKDHDVTVLNFWSTTCAPCIKEMPHFNALDSIYKNDKVKVILINLEKPERLESHIKPFVNKLNLTPQVVLLNDPNYHIWTDFVDKSWYGALPATLILKGEKRNFKFGSYETFDELKADLNKIKSK